MTVVLRRYGYRILEADNGPHALQLWSDHEDTVDLLLTDMVMPNGLSGRGLADQLRQARPDLKVIFTSGYSEELAGIGAVLREGDNFLRKPYSPTTLARAVRACLDSGRIGSEDQESATPALDFQSSD